MPNITTIAFDVDSDAQSIFSDLEKLPNGPVYLRQIDIQNVTWYFISTSPMLLQLTYQQLSDRLDDGMEEVTFEH